MKRTIRIYGPCSLEMAFHKAGEEASNLQYQSDEKEKDWEYISSVELVLVKTYKSVNLRYSGDSDDAITFEFEATFT